MRKIETSYQDPLDLIWITAARNVGIRVVRDSEVFAAWDGNGTLRIGASETLDADDSLAQMIFHEMCHALVEGPQSFSKPDWGLNIDDPKDEIREHACLRVQAALAGQYNLQYFLAATTDFRQYYDRVCDQPFSGDDPAIEIAQEPYHRGGDLMDQVQFALKKTSEIGRIIQPIASKDSIWSTVGNGVVFQN